MKRKKLVLIAFALLSSLGVMAQDRKEKQQNSDIWVSTGEQVITIEQPKVKKPKKLRTFRWNVRAGYSIDKIAGVDYLSASSGFDASFGISMPFKNERLFWGVELGGMSYGAKIKGFSSKAISFVGTLNPRIGYKFPLGQKMSINLYGGPYVGYRRGSEGSYYPYECYIRKGVDVGINIGAEYFVSKNFFFDIHVKKGFYNSGYAFIWGGSNDLDDQNLSALKIVFGIGVQF